MHLVHRRSCRVCGSTALTTSGKVKGNTILQCCGIDRVMAASA